MKHVKTVTAQTPARAMMGLGGMKSGMSQWMNEDMWNWMAEYMDGYKGIPGS
jgi:hypothetical protein